MKSNVPASGPVLTNGVNGNPVAPRVNVPLIPVKRVRLRLVLSCP